MPGSCAVMLTDVGCLWKHAADGSTCSHLSQLSDPSPGPTFAKALHVGALQPTNCNRLVVFASTGQHQTKCLWLCTQLLTMSMTMTD